jgi:hypothetical protein
VRQQPIATNWNGRDCWASAITAEWGGPSVTALWVKSPPVAVEIPPLERLLDERVRQ